MSSPAHSKTCSFRAEDLFPSVVTNQTMQNLIVQQVTKPNIKYIRKEDGKDGKCIDACALLKVATNVTKHNELKNLLTDLHHRCPAIKGCISDCHFRRKGISQGLSVRGAYHALLALGGPTVRHSCIVVGKHLSLNDTEASALFEEMTAAASEDTSSQQEEEEASQEEDSGSKTDRARHVEKMKSCSSNLEALLLATQLQKQTRGVIDHYLQQQVDTAIKQVTDLTSTEGTHDAVELLMTFGHTRREAALMANSFGSFLKAASRGIYEPNKRKQYIACSPQQVNVNLFHPIVHANIIQSAYASFRLSENYQRGVNLSAEEERESCRQVMKIQDVAQTHSRPLHLRDTRFIAPSMFDDCGPLFCDSDQLQ